MSNIILIREEEFKSYFDELKLVIEGLNLQESNSSMPKYYRNKDLKEIFGLSDGTIIKWRKENKIPFTYIDSIYFYPVDELNKRLKNNSNLDLI